MNGENERREICHYHRLIWKASLYDANRTQAGSLCPEGGYRTQPRVSTRSPQNKRFALKGREADLIKRTPIAALKIRVRN
jgi:hypothetical protein